MTEPPAPELDPFVDDDGSGLRIRFAARLAKESPDLLPGRLLVKDTDSLHAPGEVVHHDGQRRRIRSSPTRVALGSGVLTDLFGSNKNRKK